MMRQMMRLFLTFFPIIGVTKKEVKQLTPITKPYMVAVAPFSSASLGKNGGNKQTAKEDVSVANIRTRISLLCFDILNKI